MVSSSGLRHKLIPESKVHDLRCFCAARTWHLHAVGCFVLNMACYSEWAVYISKSTNQNNLWLVKKKNLQGRAHPSHKLQIITPYRSATSRRIVIQFSSGLSLVMFFLQLVSEVSKFWLYIRPCFSFTQSRQIRSIQLQLALAAEVLIFWNWNLSWHWTGLLPHFE
jgi:hypothetical protein